MTLHARSVVTAAGAPEEIFDEVLDRLVQSGEIKVWKARELVAELTSRSEFAAVSGSPRSAAPEGMGVGYGKVVLLGEHAVVYGRHAIAAPIPLAIRARIEDCDDGIHIMIPRWGVEYQLAAQPGDRRSFERAAGAILDELGLSGRSMRIEVFPEVPRGMGLGGSAAMAVAIVRALDAHFALQLNDDQINALAFESEKLAHGNPSGIDNTIACYRQALVYRPGTPALIEPLNIPKPIELVIGMTGDEGLTAGTVARVGDAWKQDPRLYERIFDQIDGLVLRAVQAIQDHDLTALGSLMNVCHGMLNALQVSTPDLERLVSIARSSGALGAKLTGGGGGGSIVALCGDDTGPVLAAIRSAGYQAFPMTLGGDSGDA
jgi:hydroxymethylglutaryl-CoA reductase